MMDNYSNASSCTTSSANTPLHVYSPMPIRTPPAIRFSMKFPDSLMSNSDSKHDARINSNGNKPNRMLYKKFLDLAKEDMDGDNW